MGSRVKGRPVACRDMHLVPLAPRLRGLSLRDRGKGSAPDHRRHQHLYLPGTKVKMAVDSCSILARERVGVGDCQPREHINMCKGRGAILVTNIDDGVSHVIDDDFWGSAEKHFITLLLRVIAHDCERCSTSDTRTPWKPSRRLCPCVLLSMKEPNRY